MVRTNVSRMRACRTFLWHSTCNFSLNSTFLRHTFVAFLNPTFQQRVLYSRGLDEQEQGGEEGNGERGEERAVAVKRWSQHYGTIRDNVYFSVFSSPLGLGGTIRTLCTRPCPSQVRAIKLRIALGVGDISTLLYYISLSLGWEI